MSFTRIASSAIAVCLMAMPIAAAHAANQEDKDIVTSEAPAAPPIAEKREHTYTHHGITISDPYHWLKDQSYPTIDDEDVLDYVKAENAWFEARMAPQKALQSSQKSLLNLILSSRQFFKTNCILHVSPPIGRLPRSTIRIDPYMEVLNKTAVLQHI